MARNTKMTKKNTVSIILPYLQGIVIGILSASLIIYLLNISGFLVVSSGKNMSIVKLLHWSYDNLGLSIIPFAITFILYCVFLRSLNKSLEEENPDSEEISAIEEKVDLLMNIFFGIGVIWTAIGMRNALLSSLGNIDAETAAQKGAFYILTNLVEGGILLALSTTIFGGIGGYIMRVIKSWAVGAAIMSFFELRNREERREVLDRLDHIAVLIDRGSDIKDKEKPEITKDV